MGSFYSGLDSRSIGFAAGGKVKKIEASGGPPADWASALKK